MTEFKYSYENSLFGILRNIKPSQFTMKNSTANGYQKDRLKNILINETEDDWCSETIPFSYFSVFFNDLYVSMTSYTFHTGNWGDNSYPSQFTVSGFDGNKWTNISNVVQTKLSNSFHTENF